MLNRPLIPAAPVLTRPLPWPASLTPAPVVAKPIGLGQARAREIDRYVAAHRVDRRGAILAR